MLASRRIGVARKRSDTLPASRARIPPLEPEPARERLLVGAGGNTFQRGRETRVDLGRHDALKKVLITLAEYRLSAPGAPISYDYVFMTAWPGKLPSADEVGRRIRGAVCALEALGMGTAIVLNDDALYLDPHLPVMIEPSG